MATSDTKDGQPKPAIETSEPKTARKKIVVGAPGSPKRRVRLDVLEVLVKRLRDTVNAVASDLGIAPDDLPPVELVDLVDGSAGLIVEQAAPAGESMIPLALAMDAVAARIAGRSIPKILTDSVYPSIDAFIFGCADLEKRGIPIRLEGYSREASPADTVMYTVLPYSPEFGVFRDRGTEAQYIPQLDPTSLDVIETGVNQAPVAPQGEWILRATGSMERLDVKARRMGMLIAGKVVTLNLDDEKFAIVDKDDARWKHVLVTARSRTPKLTSEAEVIQVLPATEHLDLEATPINEAALGLQPLLDSIEQFGQLQPEWDSYGGLPIKGAARQAAKDFLILATSAAQARGATPILPFAAPVPRGSVQLEWEQGDLYLELEFFDSRNIEYLRTVEGESSEGRATRDRALELVAWFEGSRKP